LTADGTVDKPYGINGLSVAAFNLGGNNEDLLQGLALQADGKIVLVGSAKTPLGINDIAVARLNPNGYFDPTFGVGGKQTIAFSINHDQTPYGVAVQADGQIVGAGTATVAPNDSPFAARRRRTGGAHDP